MNPNVIALLAFLGIFGAALLGMRLRTALPEHHLSQETKDTVRLGMGLVATMTALLLGLLIAAAKGSYDTQRSEVIQMAGKVDFLDNVLAIYGPETPDTREHLRRATESAIHLMGPDKSNQGNAYDVTTAQARYRSIKKMWPQDDDQRSLKA